MKRLLTGFDLKMKKEDEKLEGKNEVEDYDYDDDVEEQDDETEEILRKLRRTLMIQWMI